MLAGSHDATSDRHACMQAQHTCCPFADLTKCQGHFSSHALAQALPGESGLRGKLSDSAPDQSALPAAPSSPNQADTPASERAHARRRRLRRKRGLPDPAGGSRARWPTDGVGSDADAETISSASSAGGVTERSWKSRILPPRLHWQVACHTRAWGAMALDSNVAILS